jgi:hypothetical protein
MDLDIYTKLIPVDLKVGRRRIFAQRSYSPVRECQRVPVVHNEALELAAWFPVVWYRRGDGGANFVALRTLLPGGRGHPVGSPGIAGSLPLMLKAYPIGPRRDSSPHIIFIDDVVADQPTDIGAPILGRSGAPNTGAKQRIEAMTQFQAALPATLEMTRALEELDLLVPWNLDFPDDPHLGSFPGYLTVKPDAQESSAFVPFVRRFGLEGLRLISAHSLSLFRAGILYRRAKQDYRPLIETTPDA